MRGKHNFAAFDLGMRLECAMNSKYMYLDECYYPWILALKYVQIYTYKNAHILSTCDGIECVDVHMDISINLIAREKGGRTSF